MNLEMPNVSESRGGEKRFVFFEKRGGKKEEPVFSKFMPYAEYIQGEAKRRGLFEKMGQMIDPHTRKVDRGQICEEAILGRCVIDRNERTPVPIDRSIRTYEKAKNQMFDFAREHQPVEQEKNEQNISKEVELIIKSKLKDKNLNIADVRFYTAVGTPLDYQCGIDGWVEITDAHNKKEIVTFDLKTGAYANGSIQADILLKLDLKEDGFTAKETINELFDFTNKVLEVYQERAEL